MRSNLKVRFSAKRESEKVYDFSPERLRVRFNDEEILIDSLTIDLSMNDAPRATMRVTLTELDIDIDTVMALAAAAKIEPLTIARTSIWELDPEAVLAAKARLEEDLVAEWLQAGREAAFPCASSPIFSQEGISFTDLIEQQRSQLEDAILAANDAARSAPWYSKLLAREMASSFGLAAISGALGIALVLLWAVMR